MYIRIRRATELDRDNIHRVYWSAFPESEREIVSTLAVNLTLDKTSPPTISLVAKTEDVVVGHIAFSPVNIDSNEEFPGYILAPLGVEPKYQKRRIGSKLVESGWVSLKHC
jgi:putative acetyltransferase